MRLLWLLLPAMATMPAMAQAPFEFRPVSAESIGLFENSRPVYVYNHGVIKKEGVPDDRSRCCYVHPIHAPNGVALSDDFPLDHTHHRGVFWVWPVVTIDGRAHDLWMMRGIRKRGGGAPSTWLKDDAAGLKARNGWFVDDREVVREFVEIVARRAHGDRRTLEFQLRFEAVGSPVELRGAPTNSKGYGGFCVRFAPRTETVITTDSGHVADDQDMVPHRWARQDGLFQGRPAGLRIDIDPANPGYPNGWCLRPYGFLGVNYPGNDSYTLKPGEPLELKYTVTVFSDQ